MHSQPITCRSSAGGFTLLEVILALAILAGATAVIGELVRGGLRSAREAGDLTRAELIAQSVMARVVSGEIYPSSSGTVPVEDSPGWTYSIVLDDAAAAVEGLMLAQVTVTRDLPNWSRPVGYTLTRWIIDPNIVAQASAAAADAAAPSSPSAASSNPSNLGPGGAP